MVVHVIRTQWSCTRNLSLFFHLPVQRPCWLDLFSRKKKKRHSSSSTSCSADGKTSKAVRRSRRLLLFPPCVPFPPHLGVPPPLSDSYPSPPPLHPACLQGRARVAFNGGSKLGIQASHLLSIRSPLNSIKTNGESPIHSPQFTYNHAQASTLGLENCFTKLPRPYVAAVF